MTSLQSNTGKLCLSSALAFISAVVPEYQDQRYVFTRFDRKDPTKKPTLGDWLRLDGSYGYTWDEIQDEASLVRLMNFERDQSYQRSVDQAKLKGQDPAQVKRLPKVTFSDARAVALLSLDSFIFFDCDSAEATEEFEALAIAHKLKKTLKVESGRVGRCCHIYALDSDYFDIDEKIEATNEKKAKKRLGIIFEPTNDQLEIRVGREYQVIFGYHPLGTTYSSNEAPILPLSSRFVASVLTNQAALLQEAEKRAKDAEEAQKLKATNGQVTSPLASLTPVYDPSDLDQLRKSDFLGSPQHEEVIDGYKHLFLNIEIDGKEPLEDQGESNWDDPNHNPPLLSEWFNLITPAYIREWVGQDYDEWLIIGQVLHSLYVGTRLEDAAKALWVYVSYYSDLARYLPGGRSDAAVNCEDKWKSFDSEGKRTFLTLTKKINDFDRSRLSQSNGAATTSQKVKKEAEEPLVVEFSEEAKNQFEAEELEYKAVSGFQLNQHPMSYLDEKIAEVAQAGEYPEDKLYFMALICASSVLAKKTGTRMLTGNLIPSNIWGVLVGKPATGKSRLLSPFVDVIKELGKSPEKSNVKAVSIFRAEIERLKKMTKKEIDEELDQRFIDSFNPNSAVKLPENYKELSSFEQKQLLCPSPELQSELYVNSATLEAIYKLSNLWRDRGFLWTMPELDSLFNDAKKATNNDPSGTICAIYDCESAKKDTATGDKFLSDFFQISLLTTIQTGVAEKLHAIEDAKGFWSRCIVLHLDNYRRRLNSEKQRVAVDLPGLQLLFKAVIERLISDIPYGYEFTLSDEAQQIFEDFEDKTITLQDTAEHDGVRSCLARLPDQLVKLAQLIHCLGIGADLSGLTPQISAWAMRKAEDLLWQNYENDRRIFYGVRIDGDAVKHELFSQMLKYCKGETMTFKRFKGSRFLYDMRLKVLYATDPLTLRTKEKRLGKKEVSMFWAEMHNCGKVIFDEKECSITPVAK